MKRLGTNILANYAGRVWGFLSLFIFTPVYFKYLGQESFGIVGLYTAIVSVLMLGDFGLSSSLNRRLASLSSGNNDLMPSALRTNEAVMVFVICLITSIYWVVIKFTDFRLLETTSENLPVDSFLPHLVFLCAITHLLANLYISGLMGLEWQVNANIVQVLWGIARGVGCVLGLIYFDFDVVNFFLWQLVCSIIYCATLRSLLWKLVGRYSSSESILAVSELKHTGNFALGVFFISLLSVFVGQFDKFAVTTWLGLEAMSYYTLATTAAMLPIIVVSPIGVAMYPRFSSLMSAGRKEEAQILLVDSFRLVFHFLLPILVLIILQNEFILGLWLQDVEIVNEISIPFQLLIFGQFLQALTLLFYYFVLASGQVSLSAIVSIVAAVFYIPIMLYLIDSCGINGVALSFFMMNAFIFPIYLGVIKIHFYRNFAAAFFRKLDWFSFFLFSFFALIFFGNEYIQGVSFANFCLVSLMVMALGVLNISAQTYLGSLNIRRLRAVK